MLVSVVMTAIN